VLIRIWIHVDLRSVCAARWYASAALAVMWCLCVRVSVTFMASVKAKTHIFKIFSPSSSHTILVFSVPNVMAIFRRVSPNGGVECRSGRQKSWFWVYIWLQCVLSVLRPARCYQHGVAWPRSHKLWHLSLIVSGRACRWRETTTKCLWQDQRYAKDSRTAFNCTQW